MTLVINYQEHIPSAPPPPYDDDETEVSISKSHLPTAPPLQFEEFKQEKETSHKDIVDNIKKNDQKYKLNLIRERLEYILNKIKKKIDGGICMKNAKKGLREVFLWKCYWKSDKNIFKYTKRYLKTSSYHINIYNKWFIDSIKEILPKDVFLSYRKYLVSGGGFDDNIGYINLVATW